MSCNVYINFDGNCRQAVEFYQKVFKLDAPDIMTYGQAPDLPGHIPASDMERILHTRLPIAGGNMMFADCPSIIPLTKGDNVAISLGFTDKKEIERIFNELSEGGDVIMPLGKTFFSELFAMFKDKFGIIWQLSAE